MHPSLAWLFLPHVSQNCMNIACCSWWLSPQSSSLPVAGCYVCLQKASSAPIGQVAMKSTPSSGKQQTGQSCFPLDTLSKSLLGSQAAPTYLPVILSRSEVVMQFVTASEMQGQPSPANPAYVAISPIGCVDQACDSSHLATLKISHASKKSSCKIRIDNTSCNGVIMYLYVLHAPVSVFLARMSCTYTQGHPMAIMPFACSPALPFQSNHTLLRPNSAETWAQCAMNCCPAGAVSQTHQRGARSQTCPCM